MVLPKELIDNFAKITDYEVTNNGETVYGTVVVDGTLTYVRLDGSDVLTPVTTTTNIKNGERVTVLVKNHSATVTGNLSSPAARTAEVEEVGGKVENFDKVMSHNVTTDELEATNALIDTLKSRIAQFDNMEAVNAEIDSLRARLADFEYISADDMKVINADIENIRAMVGTFTDLSADDLKAITADIDNLKAYTATFTYVSADVLDAVKANIKSLETEKLSAKDADIKYANIDFSNIGNAAMEYFYAQSGLIKNVTVGDQTITGELVGVTIRGDLIEGNTIVADKLVMKGEDGVYYKLNTDGMTVGAEQTDYNSLNGQIIRAKSITAEKVAVEDLVAFGATIGGFRIGNTSIYSGVKESVDNTTRGIYMDNTGQIAFGDGSNFVKYYKDQNGNYKLAISAESITFGINGTNIDDTFSDMQEEVDAAIISSIEQHYQSDSPTELTGGDWSIVEPIWQDGKYIWRRTKVTYGSGKTEYTPSENGVCITGNTGSKGEDSTLLRIESSRGTVFKNDSISTVLSVVIYKGSQRITDSETMKSVYGNSAYLQWKWRRIDDESFGVISSGDPRFGDNGFTFTLSPEDVDTKITFMCELIT